MTKKEKQTANEAPSLAEVIRGAIQAQMFELNTAMPGIVQSYNASTNTASVQPAFKRTYAEPNDTPAFGTPEEELVDLPIINNVPVCFPRAGQAAITFPLKPQDTVLLIFAQRSIDKWKNLGGNIAPDDPRTHALSDAIAIPGVYPSSNPVLVDPDNLVIRHVLAKITVKKDALELAAGAGLITVNKAGKVTVGNGVVDLLALLDQTLDAIKLLTVPTAVGPSGIPNNAAAFEAIKTALASIKA